MPTKTVIAVKEFAEALGMTVEVPGRPTFEVETSDIYRPGMQCTGYFKHFVYKRVQLFGNAEMTYLKELDPAVADERMERYFSYAIPAVCMCQGHAPTDEMVRHAMANSVPILRSTHKSTKLSHLIVGYLDEKTSPCITRHGGLLDVYGVGIMLVGESGIGKSETALELVKRNHRLVADDVIEIRRLGDDKLKGTAPELVRYLMEVRGIGIIDVSTLYGIGSVLNEKEIDLVIEMQDWNDQKEYDRLGVAYSTTEILDVAVPSIVLPVRPGRNLAIIVEVAAMNFRLKRMGFDAAVEFDKRLTEKLAEP